MKSPTVALITGPQDYLHMFLIPQFSMSHPRQEFYQSPTQGIEQARTDNKHPENLKWMKEDPIDNKYPQTNRKNTNYGWCRCSVLEHRGKEVPSEQGGGREKQQPLGAYGPPSLPWADSPCCTLSCLYSGREGCLPHLASFRILREAECLAESHSPGLC